MDENSVAAVIPAKLDVGLAAEAVVDVPRSHMGECGAGSVDDDAAAWKRFRAGQIVIGAALYVRNGHAALAKR